MHCIITKGQSLKENTTLNFRMYVPFIKAALNLRGKKTELKKIDNRQNTFS